MHDDRIDLMLTFRSLREQDLPLLHSWLARPHVAEWWSPTPSLDELAEEYGPLTSGDGPHRAYIVLDGETPIGFIQSYTPALTHDEGWWLDEHDVRVRGIDQFLANADQLNRGLGTAMVRAFVERLLAEPDVSRVQTDPSPNNARAIRCYEKAGFRSVGVVDTLDGPALLMYADPPTSVR